VKKDKMTAGFFKNTFEEWHKNWPQSEKGTSEGKVEQESIL
jgi:hypothetical protein